MTSKMWPTKFIAAICLGKINMETINRKILATGSADFIGSALEIRLLARSDTLIGIDNHINFGPWYRNEFKLI